MKIGALSDEAVGYRDAIHVPVVTATFATTAGHARPLPGQKVKFVDDRLLSVRGLNKTEKAADEYHAVVDPFVTVDTVETQGVKFNVLIRPDYVSKLNHQFEPAIPDLVHFEEAEDVEDEPEDEEYDSCRGCY